MNVKGASYRYGKESVGLDGSKEPQGANQEYKSPHPNENPSRCVEGFVTGI